MGRSPCCDKSKVKKGTWSPEEDATLTDYLYKYGTGGNWIALPHKAGLQRCGKSCRLRWLNYLRPDIKHGAFTQEEEHIICNLYTTIGSRWSVIASHLQGRTDNDVKNYWNSKLKKKLMPPHSRTNAKTLTTTTTTTTMATSSDTTINVNETTIFRTNPQPTSFPVSFPRDNFTGLTNAEAQIPPHGPTNFNLSRLILEGSNCHSSGNKSCHFSPSDDQNSTSPFRPFCLGMDESYGEKEIAMDNEYPCGVVNGFWSQEEAFGGDRNADLFSIFHFDSKSHGVSQSH